MLNTEQIISTKRFIRLMCVKERNGGNIHVGEVVYGDITTFFIDDYGNTYMEMYDAFGNYLGIKILKNFRELSK